MAGRVPALNDTFLLQSMQVNAANNHLANFKVLFIFEG